MEAAARAAAVEDAYDSEIAPGHLSLELSSEGLLPFVDDDDDGEPVDAGAAPASSASFATVSRPARRRLLLLTTWRPPLPSRVAGIKSARERRAAKAEHNEYDDMSSRSGLLRDYMMTHVMPVVTQGLLECIKTRPEDATDFMADYLTVEAKSASARMRRGTSSPFRHRPLPISSRNSRTVIAPNRISIALAELEDDPRGLSTQRHNGRWPMAQRKARARAACDLVRPDYARACATRPGRPPTCRVHRRVDLPSESAWGRTRQPEPELRPPRARALVHTLEGSSECREVSDVSGHILFCRR